MTKTKFQSLPEAERENALAAEAYKVENSIKLIPYSKEELDSFKDSHVSLHMEMAETEAEIKALVAPLKEKIKRQRSSAKEFLNMLANGGEEHKVKIYGFVNEEEGLMEFYDASGQFVSSRRLLPSEREQPKLVGINRAVNQ